MRENKTPLVSIIIVTYNADKYLQDCLSSVKSQVFKGYEIVILDGGSTDRTIDILKQNDTDITFWKSEKDEGIYDAMNKAIKHCKGKWLYFLGSDDKLMPGFSEMANKLAVSNTIYYGDCITNNPNIFLGGKYDNYRLAKMNICHHAIFYPRQVFDFFSYEKEYIVSADHVLNIKCWNNKHFVWQYFPITTAKYRLNGFSSTTKDVCFKENRAELIKTHLGLYAFFRFKLKRYKERNNPKSYVN